MVGNGSGTCPVTVHPTLHQLELTGKSHPRSESKVPTERSVAADRDGEKSKIKTAGKTRRTTPTPIIAGKFERGEYEYFGHI
ncbi:hypothetical protein JTB14_026215 [Gonioctena quinquepunctata]|nr:hypothetical protein JTB14_026215 [Gonioctena quinquepunctata]